MSIINKILKGVKENGWDSYIQMKDEILKEDSRDLILNLLSSNKFHEKDVSYLLLIIPELWKDFNLEDWKYLIRNVKRVSNYRFLLDSYPCFEDIKFLYNWIGIDSISLYQDDIKISSEDKAVLDKVFPGILNDNMRGGEFYKEDFEDGTFGNIEYFREMRQRLISEGALANELPDL